MVKHLQKSWLDYMYCVIFLTKFKQFLAKSLVIISKFVLIDIGIENSIRKVFGEYRQIIYRLVISIFGKILPFISDLNLTYFYS